MLYHTTRKITGHTSVFASLNKVEIAWKLVYETIFDGEFKIFRCIALYIFLYVKFNSNNSLMNYFVLSGCCTGASTSIDDIVYIIYRCTKKEI